MSDPSTPPSAEAQSATAPRAGTLVALVRLHWFIRLRWIFAGVTLAVIAAERFLRPEIERPMGLLVAVLAVGLINGVWSVVAWLLHQRLSVERQSQRATLRSAEVFANAQISADLLLLTVILHYTGGTENPMSVFYLFHVAIGSLLLARWQAALQSVWAVMLYCGMALLEWLQVLQHHPLLPLRGSPGWYAEGEYVLLLIVITAAAVFGTFYFLGRIADTVDRQEEELLRTNIALERSRLAIQDLQQRRARFMQTAAHQLKAPLAIVQTLASLIQDGLVKDEEGIRATCQKISSRSAEGIVQVTELLTYARIQEADPARHARSDADVCEVVSAVCERVRPVAEGKSLALVMWLPQARGMRVRVDESDLRDCVENLVDNAIKYTPEGGRVRVMVTLRDEADPPTAVCIHVSDTGIGFDPKLLRSGGDTLAEELVFDAFRRGANAITAGISGTGLGLSIVREVVEQAGGRIWVMSRLGHGTSFTVMLPLVGGPRELPGIRDTRSTRVVLEEEPSSPAEDRSAPPVS